MAGEWLTTTFENAPLEIIDGDRGTNYPSQAEFSTSGHCLFLNAGNVTTSGFNFADCAFITLEKDALLRKGKLVRNDVALTTRGTIGNSAYFDDFVQFDHIRINSGMVILRAQTSALEPRYLYLFVRSALFQAQVSALRTGSAQPQLPIKDINRIEIPIPPLDEQRAIAHILGKLDDKIELNRRMNETLEAIAHAIFKSWFVDFDPVRAKAAGRDPGLPKHIADLFPDSFEDSELGSIPNGWEVRTVGDLAEVSSGSRPNVRYDEALPEAYVPLWGGNGPMAFVPEPLIDYPILLTGRVGTLGSVFRITSPCWPSDNTLILRARQSRAFDYLFLQLKRVDFSSLNRGSTQPLLTQTDLKSQFVVLPPTAVLERFHAFAKELYERIDASESESRTLAALRDSLLPKLISGEMRVKGADILLEAKG